jgi:hypothetical protein
MASPLSPEFLNHVAQIHEKGVDQPRLKWYITMILAFGGMNYPELIPDLYEILLNEHILESEHVNETRKIREALTKVCGIWGAAKVRGTLLSTYGSILRLPFSYGHGIVS